MTQMKLKYVRNILLSIAFALIFYGAGYQVAHWQIRGNAPGAIRTFLSDPNREKVDGVEFANFWEVWRRLEQSYVDPEKIDYQDMTYGSIKGLASSLGDPYTQYLPPAQNKLSQEDLQGAFYGVGIELGYKDNTLAVVAPLEGGPAKEQGVQAGDMILHLKDESKGLDEDTDGITLAEAVQKIRGERGVPITLTLYREGVQQPFEVVIEREEIVIPSLELEYIIQGDKKIAHLMLHRFGGRTETEWGEKVGEIVANNVDGVILDLRNNPGGFLDGSVFVAGEFLSDGVVVMQQGRYRTETYSVDRRGSLTSMPLVVLVNKGSASASEIAAGALQDHGRAQLVGESTFGKGTVQEVQDLPDGSSLHVTIAKWLLPQGSFIGEGGVTPDFEIQDDPETEDIDEQLRRALELLI